MRSPIRVAAYVDLRYTTRKPTGVDKHIARMVHGLASTPGCGVSVLAPRQQLAGNFSECGQFSTPFNE